MSGIIPQTIEGLSPAEAAAEIRRLRAELDGWQEEKRTLIETANKTARIVAYGSAADALRMASGAIARLGDPDANGVCIPKEMIPSVAAQVLLELAAKMAAMSDTARAAPTGEKEEGR